MTDEHDDDYLWTARGPATADVAALEQSLASLRWSGLAVERDAEADDLASLDRREPKGASAEASASWWPALAGGLLAIAAVLALLLWLLPGSSADMPPQLPVQPTGRPSTVTSPDLKDPFAGRDAPGFTTPITEADPSPTPTTNNQAPAPDLKDPFANGPQPQPQQRQRPSKQQAKSSPDLKDPFARERGGEVLDPWAGQRPSSPTDAPSPDLKDPFKRD